MLEVTFGEQKIKFERLSSKSKNTITIGVDSGKKVSVKAPADLTEGELTQIVKTKSPWILGKFHRIDEIKEFQNTQEFVSGESFPYKGKLLRLKVIPSEDESVYSDTTTIFCKTKENAPKKVSQSLETWYKQRARQYLENRAVHLSNKFKVKPSRLSIRNQNLRWGSCTKKGELLLNWRIIMAPPSVIDYVITHELAHLQEKNHSPKFWDAVKNAMPNYEEKKDWLRINGASLSLKGGA